MTPTRGERNSNPGNLDRNATRWQGMSVDQSGDPRFVVFDAPVWGIRALAKILLSYYRAHNLRTVRAVISRWAPPVENDTEAYVKAVAKALSVEPDERINVEDATTLDDLVTAVIKHENGRCIYDDATIVEAVDKALGA